MWQQRPQARELLLAQTIISVDPYPEFKRY